MIDKQFKANFDARAFNIPIGTKELQNKMLTEKNVNWNDYKTDEKRGIAAIKDNEGKWFIDELTPIFTEDRDYINRLVYPESDD